MSASDPKDYEILCQIDSESICFFNDSKSPVCLRNSNAQFVYCNNPFFISFINRRKKISIPFLIDEITAFSDDVKMLLSKFELECAFLSSSTAQSRNILIEKNVWQVRIETIIQNGNVFFLWQFNKFSNIGSLIKDSRGSVFKNRYVDISYLFERLSDKEFIIFPFYLLGFGYAELATKFDLDEDVVRKRVLSAMRKMEILCDVKDWKCSILTGKNLFYICSVIKCIIDDDVMFL